MGANAILTGSYAYGTPHEKSDIDIAVLMDFYEMAAMAAIARERKLQARTLESSDDGNCNPSQTCEHSVSIRFGNVNIIACCRDVSFQLWKDGTEILKAARPVTRDHAIAVFNRLRAERGL